MGISGERRKDLEFGLVVMRLGFGQGIEFLLRCDCDLADTVCSQPWSLRPLLRHGDLNGTR